MIRLDGEFKRLNNNKSKRIIGIQMGNRFEWLASKRNSIERYHQGNAIQYNGEEPLPPVRTADSDTTKDDEDMKRRRSLHTAGRIVNKHNLSTLSIPKP